MARVLIVQGHARSRADTAATPRAEGHEVLEAGSADNGVRLAHEQGPEVILVDPMPPDRSGYELYASLLHESCRTGDTVARLEAEAFLLLLPGTKLDAAWYVAERVRRRTAAIGAALGPDGPSLTASFGVAEHRPPDAWRDLLDRAEAALTRAKRAGRNRCEVA